MLSDQEMSSWAQAHSRPYPPPRRLDATQPMFAPEPAIAAAHRLRRFQAGVPQPGVAQPTRRRCGALFFRLCSRPARTSPLLEAETVPLPRLTVVQLLLRFLVMDYSFFLCCGIWSPWISPVPHTA
jgi:hypothetical protein